MDKSLRNRERMIEAAKVEIVGPSAIHEFASQLSVKGNTVLEADEAYKNYYWMNGGVREEILQYEYPSRRYAAGVLFPTDTTVGDTVGNEVVLENTTDDKKAIERDASVEEDSEEVAIQNDERLPSSLGVTCNISDDTRILTVELEGARYKSHMVTIKGKGSRKWWLRETLGSKVELQVDDLLKQRVSKQRLPLFNKLNEEITDIHIELHIQCREIYGQRLTTVTITNRSKTGKKESSQLDEKMLFQAGVVLQADEKGKFISYPKHYQRNLPMTDDEANDELLYRNKINYAFGHGCSTAWNDVEVVREIRSTFIPTYETASMTPDVEVTVKGKLEKINVKMIDLVNAKSFAQLETILMPIINGYSHWIKEREAEIPKLSPKLQKAARCNLDLCKESLARMENGLQHLVNMQVRDAFVLANKAILLQQVNGKKTRTPIINGTDVVFDMSYENTVLKLDKLQTSKNSWRAFQIAFFLMSLDSIVNDESIEREIVDLIWFPTGGGKTEAYLGVAAFEMFYRRILNPLDAGVDVMMRYTLRLLTADQFQRSSRLMCAMEVIRREQPHFLGKTPYSIGMWVGSSTSPNSYSVAFEKLRGLKQGRKDSEFIVSKCPWCGCTLGKIGKGKSTLIIGYKQVGSRFVTFCPDKACDFSDEIPVYFIDEAIYEHKPTFLIGTVDKFVQLTWNPKARAIFGIGENGEQLVTPPNLIIQDELHLISGPLGTLAGLFETVIEELCTKTVNGKRIKPKIISATATIKEFGMQAKCLFGREQAKLFPSPGLDIDDSFFAKVAVDENGNPLPGRKYAGIFTSNVGLLMAQVKVFSGVLQEGNQIPATERDPYWTLLSFYNSLRDLGAGINLCSMDIPTYMRSIQNREGYQENRFIKDPLELTSRMQSDEVTKTIDKLKVELTANNQKSVLDVCLASNIIEVGVDIDRLSMMAVVGQPKTTAQYIQVTGRVGRRWTERPGIIFTLYSNRNSRDKSHFEHFIEYHQRLYAQVETTSVTPFSDASLERGLNAVLISFLRQRFSKVIAMEPNVEEYVAIIQGDCFKGFVKKLTERVKLVDIEQLESFRKAFLEFDKLMKSAKFSSWKADDQDTQGMMYMSGDPIASKVYPNAIPMINSLRSVDATSLGKITMDIASVDATAASTDFDWEDLLS